MSHQHIDDGGLRHVGIEAADRAFARHRAAIERRRAQYGVEIGHHVRQHAQQHASASAVIALFGIGHATAHRPRRAKRLGAGGEVEEYGVTSAKVRTSTPRITRACWGMPLWPGPTTRRRPRRSLAERRSESARAMKNNGPAFIGAAMRRSIFA